MPPEDLALLNFRGDLGRVEGGFGEKPVPDGLRVDPSGDRTGATLCTLVADLTAGEVVLAPRGDRPVRVSLPELVNGSCARRDIVVI